MKNYVIINGTNSNTLTGLMINELPPITKPEMRTQVEEIDGRDGDIITKLGYSAYDKTITIGLFGTGYDVDNIIKFFNKEGTIVFSNEPDKYYNFTQVNNFDIERLLKFKTASITFHCQPFKYPTIETQKIIQPTILTSDGESITINNTAVDNLGIDLKGNTSQASTPTPTSPIPVSVVSGDNEVYVIGKNLFIGADSKEHNGITFTKNSDGSYKIKGTASANANDMIYATIGESGLINGESYILSTNKSAGGLEVRVELYNNNTWVRSLLTSSTITPVSFNLSGGDRIRYGIFVANGYSVDIPDFQVQLEHSNTKTNYAPYTSQTYPINLPVENLFDKTAITTGKSVSSSTGALYNDSNSFATDYINVKGISNIAFNGKSSSNGVWGAYYDDNQQFVSGFSGNYTTLNVSSYSYVRIGILNTYLDTLQIEPGTKANHYTEYGTTPIELCKIGTYQDRIYKDSGKWYLHKEIGKVVLDGTNLAASKRQAGANSKYIFCFNYDNALRGGATLSGVIKCDKLGNKTRDTTYNNNEGISIAGDANDFWGTGCNVYITDTATMSLSDFNTWLQSHIMTVYYVLASQTTTLIEDNNLIEQLDNLSNATSYEGTTNVGQTNNDKPFIISASAVQSGTNEITINNIGNIYSKPLIALEGNGNVDIYLDNTQILKANVESKMNIDINTLEAYNPDTSALLNRQVIGNYNSMTFQPGNNKLTINGALSKATITNYTRWL